MVRVTIDRGTRWRARRSSRLVVVPSTTGATIPPLFTSGTRCAPEHTRRKLDGRRIDKETSTNEGCSTSNARRRKRDGESRGEIERGMMETRRGMETRPTTEGEERESSKKEREREGGGGREVQVGGRRAAEEMNSKRGYPRYSARIYSRGLSI